MGQLRPNEAPAAGVGPAEFAAAGFDAAALKAALADRETRERESGQTETADGDSGMGLYAWRRFERDEVNLVASLLDGRHALWRRKQKRKKTSLHVKMPTRIVLYMGCDMEVGRS